MNGFFLPAVAYNASVVRVFPLQMVSLTPRATIPPGRWPTLEVLASASSACSWWPDSTRSSATGPGRRPVSRSSRHTRLGNGYVDFRRLRSVHLTSAEIAFVTCKCGGAARAKFNRTHRRSDPRAQHPDGDRRHLHPLLRLVRVQRRSTLAGWIRSSPVIATNRSAGAAAALGDDLRLVEVLEAGIPPCSPTARWRPWVAITAPCARQRSSAVMIGLIAGRDRLRRGEHIERGFKMDARWAHLRPRIQLLLGLIAWASSRRQLRRRHQRVGRNVHGLIYGGGTQSAAH